MLLNMERVCKTYGDRTLLDHVTFYMKQGDRVGVVGVNGCGKSTFLRLAAGREKPDSGAVSYDPNVRLGYLPQDPPFDPENTVMEQVEAGLDKTAREVARYEAVEILTRLGITDTQQKMGSLSGGQRKRVALAACLVHPADLLLLDEPTNHLDAEMIGWLENYLQRFTGGILLVTHDRYFLERVADRTLEVSFGRVYLYEGGYSAYLDGRAHREEMDEGAEIAWEARYNPDELSAIQHAMNLRFLDEVAFWAEYQNEPLPEDLGSEEQLSVDMVIHKLNGMKVRSVPVACNHITMFVDIQKTLLFYVVCAWEDDFTGYVIDYGAYPDQQRRYFSLAEANPTLQSVAPRTGIEGSIFTGLEKLTEDYLGREFTRDDGAMMRIERCLIDANWGASTDLVYQFCRQSKYSNILLPSHGRYIGAASKPMSEYKKTAGDRVGHNWRIPNVAGRRAIRHVIFDTNYWKTFIHARMQVAMGDRGCLSLWGREPERHLLFAEHLTAEYRVKTEGRGRTVDEWKMRPEAHDNHWLDGLVGCAVAASMCGSVLPGTDSTATKIAKPRLKLSELRAQRKKV